MSDKALTPRLDGRQRRLGGARGGRPTIRTPELVDAVLDALRQGAFMGVACDIARVNLATWTEWRLRDPELNAQVRAAVASAQLQATRLLMQQNPERYLVFRHKRWASIYKGLKTPPQAPIQILLQMPVEQRKQEALKLAEKIKMLTEGE